MLLRSNWPEHLPYSSSGIVVLGSPIGSDGYIMSHYQSVVESGWDLCDMLPLLDDPQCSTLMLRQCHLTRLNHRWRMVPPAILLEAAKAHDTGTHDTFWSIVGLNASCDDNWSQCCLPIKLGFWKLEDISPTAFLAAWANSLRVLPARFTGMDAYIHSVYENDLND